MSYISKYELEALGEPLGDCVTTPKLGGGYFCGGGGGGGPTSTTVTQSNIPEWLAPQIQAMLGAGTEEFFTTEQGEDGTRYITGIKPYTPYSEDPNAYVAPFTGLQQSAFQYAQDVGTPWEYASAGSMLGNAGLGAYGMGNLGLDYGGAGYESGSRGEAYGTKLGALYGDMGAGYGTEAARIAGYAPSYGEAGAAYGRGAQEMAGMYGGQLGNIGLQYGAGAAGLAPGAAGLGSLYERMATTPEEFQRYMSPYQQTVIERQKEGAIRDAGVAAQQRGAAAARAGAFGGARQAIENAEANRTLQSQLQGIESTGLQQAYQQAQGNILNRAQLESQGLGQAGQLYGAGMQGAQVGLQGLEKQLAGAQLGMQGAGVGLQGLGQAGQLYGVGMQGAGLGLQGVQQMLAGTAQGMQGAGMGLQGVGQGLAGYGLMGQMGGQLGALGGQRLKADMDIANMRYGYGQQQQQMEQQKINQAIQNFARGQERPYDLLSMYNALIRGYSTPGQTTTQYQAPPSTASQLAGLGTAGLGFSALANMGKKAGGVVNSDTGIDRLALRKALAGD